MPTLTGEEVTIREGNKRWCCRYQKGNYELKTKYWNELYPASEEHAYRAGFYTIPYIQAYIRSWHIANTRK